ncbi:ProQ/FINO family protein, partial [Halomonas sp.]|uniref:ProQ/FINO family protein n=1 Tax=Halomonas sp. TaxID=1486246 RepID=UPI0025C6EA53
MTEERSIRLLDALEGRTDTLLERLRQERESRLALQQRLAELEAARLALAEKARELEANRLELVEENRELDEQNRELEEHNRHLHERLAKGPGENTFPRPARRSQGLSALMGRSSSETSAGSSAGARFIGGPTPRRAAEAPSPDTPSPDRPGADNTVGDASEAPSPQALLAEWYRRYPAAFFKGHTRPLKVGIHEELAAREPWPEKLVRRALACYVNLPRYLKAVREGAERIDLAGQPAGVVDAQAAEHARKKLERLQA